MNRKKSDVRKKRRKREERCSKKRPLSSRIKTAKPVNAGRVQVLLEGNIIMGYWEWTELRVHGLLGIDRIKGPWVTGSGPN